MNDNSRTDRRYCIIGAGYAGNGAAKALADAGIPYDQLERNDYIGGNWADGVYDSTHIISSRDTTEYGDYPMPRDYPAFPSREQVLAYLNDYVDHFDLRERIEFGQGVIDIRPLDSNGLGGWRVELASGEVRHYAGVIVANGHHWDRRYPDYPGTFSGKQIHSKDYRRTSDLDGDRILVVGGGNSACDIAVEAAQGLGHAEISLRRGYWFLPKSFLGVPLAEMDRPWLPLWAQRGLAKIAARATFGDYGRYGLPEPDHRPFDCHPTVNSQLLYALRHGRVRPRPDIDRLDAHTVHFVDGTHAEYDTIVWATGFHASFPFLDRRLFEWRNGYPVRVGSLMAPGLANLYVFGLLQPRGGAGPLITAGAEALARIIQAQEHLDHPIGDDISRLRPPSARMLVGVSETMRQIKAGQALLPALLWVAKLQGRSLDEPPALPPASGTPSETQAHPGAGPSDGGAVRPALEASGPRAAA
jgi:cation diffusion facilitator CzcD-associated flavoprotein CzcO